MIIIKKYPNRRLYDTSQSRYINMDAVRTLIRRDQAFVVQDSKSGEDITRQILMQIICEHEGRSHNTILPRALLKELIRQYGSGEQALLRKHLELAWERFADEVSNAEAGEGGSEAAPTERHWAVGEAAALEERVNYLAASGSVDISS